MRERRRTAGHTESLARVGALQRARGQHPPVCPNGRRIFESKAQVEGTLTGEVGLRCQLTHRPQRDELDSDERPPARAGGRFTSPLRKSNPQVTADGDSSTMRSLAVVFAALSLGGLAGAAGAAGVPPFPRLPGTW